MHTLCLAAALILALSVLGCASGGASPDDNAGTPEQTLDRLHLAASRADGDTYFALFAPEAVFLGTDASERWTLDQFKAYAKPYFDRRRGWTYTVRARNLSPLPGGRAVFFDETLWNEKYGLCRGTGVLRLDAGEWRIAQYSLSVPIPNDMLPGIAEQIRARGTPAP